MPKTLLVKFYERKSKGKRPKTRYQYTLSMAKEPLVKVVMAKETHKLTKYAGWGLKALTHIPANRCIGYFKKERMSKTPIVGRYCFPKGKKWFVAHEDSLMNVANTIPYAKDRKNLCNAKLVISKDNQFAIKATRDIQPNKFIWVDYGNVPSHYWKIQYEICKARLMLLKKRRRGSANDHNDDNDDRCRKCKKRHEELVMCDTCPIAVCGKCMTTKEKYIFCKSSFFCKDCLDSPPKNPNYFVKTKNRKLSKTELWLTHANDKRYLSTFGGNYDLDMDWKNNHNKIINMFTRVNISNVEFINFKGSDSNDRFKWTIDVVEALVTMLDKKKTRCYGINLGEIYFTQEALLHLHKQLHRTWIGFIFIEPRYNDIDCKQLQGCFRYTTKIDKILYPNGSNIMANRKKFPKWYKNGKIAPWYDKSNLKFLDSNETMAKCFYSPVNSKYFK